MLIRCLKTTIMNTKRIKTYKLKGPQPIPRWYWYRHLWNKYTADLRAHRYQAKQSTLEEEASLTLPVGGAGVVTGVGLGGGDISA